MKRIRIIFLNSLLVIPIISVIAQEITTKKCLLSLGHRGAAGHEPENTLRSFKKALELGVDMIELDAHLSKSGDLIVIHDDKVDRTTSGSGLVSEKTLKQLKRLNIEKNEKIPTLHEVVNLVNRKAPINIELKGPNTAGAVANLTKDYIKNKKWNKNDFLVSSFDHNELLKFHKLNPDIKTVALIEAIPVGYAEFGTKAKADYIGISKDFINQHFVDDAHKRGLQVFVYTVDDLNEIDKIKKLGVDGIFSNYPDRVINPCSQFN